MTFPMPFFAPPVIFVFSATISSNTLNYNIRTAAIAAGWDQALPLQATVTVNAGVYVGSTSTGSYAFNTGGSFPSGSSLALINNGYILGAGGAGGAGRPIASASAGTGSAGGAGGHAFYAQAPITVTNNGTIGGGGGGGGGGGCAYSTWMNGKACDPMNAGGGGGGGGAGWYSGGAGGGGAASPYGATFSKSGASGSPGSTSGGGGGGAGGYVSYTSYAHGGTGGSGGGLGAAGSTGATSTCSGACGCTNYAGYAGAAAGYCVYGNANITWAATGTRYGSLV